MPPAAGTCRAERTTAQDAINIELVDLDQSATLLRKTAPCAKPALGTTSRDQPAHVPPSYLVVLVLRGALSTHGVLLFNP